MLSRDAELKLVWRAFCLTSEFWICLHRLHQLRRFALLVGAVMGVEIGETSSVCRCRWALLQLAPNSALVTVSLFMRLHAKCESSVKRNTYLPWMSLIGDECRGIPTRGWTRQPREMKKACAYTVGNELPYLVVFLEAFG